MAKSCKTCKVLPAPIRDHFLPILDHPPPYCLCPLFLIYFVLKSLQILFNIFYPIPYALQMDVDLRQHLDLDLPGYEFLWNCAICLKPAWLRDTQLWHVCNVVTMTSYIKDSHCDYEKVTITSYLVPKPSVIT